MPEPSTHAPRASVPATDRLTAAFVAGCCMALLGTAAWLRPAHAGMGTHMELGLPPCGWMAASGHPCPTCGMTTAFSNLAHLHPLTAILAQPFGALLAPTTTVVFWGALHVALFGSRLGSVALGVLRPRMLWVFAGLWAASWAYKTWAVSVGIR